MDGRAWLVVLALMGCGEIDESRLDSGPYASVDAPRDVPPLPDAPVDVASIDRAIDVAALETSLAWGLGDDLDTFHRGPRTDDDAFAILSRALPREQLVSPATCASTTWAGLTATVVLSGCALGVGGGAIEGTLVIEVVREPASLQISLEGLTVRGSPIEGSVALTPGELTRPDIWRIFDGSVSVDEGGSRSTIVTHGSVGIWEHEVSLGVWFQGTWTRGDRTDDIVANLGWREEACLPWNGSLSFDSVPFADSTWLTFLETTPTDGVVSGMMDRLSCR